jgi:transcriptional regulator GlxA family with amidase domain
MKRKRVGIVIFPEVEVLDFCGPYEVFTVTRLDETRRREEPSPFQVQLVAEREETIATAAGMRVLPDCTLAACPPWISWWCPAAGARGGSCRIKPLLIGSPAGAARLFF